MIEYFYLLKPPGNKDYTFVTKETYYSAAKKVGDSREQIFVFIGDDESGDEWRGKAAVRNFVKDRG